MAWTKRCLSLHQSPYCSFVETQSRQNPSLQNLASFLTSTTSQFSCQIVYLEFHNTVAACPPKRRSLDQSDLVSLLENRKRDANILGRLLIIEDLSRELVECLGSSLDIDPFFFASHMDTLQSDITMKRPSSFMLPSRSTVQNFVNLHYQHVLEFEGKTKQKFLYRRMNMTRKVVVLEVKGVELGLARHCCSILRTIGKDGLWLGVILLDPLSTSYTTRPGNNATVVTLPSRPFLGGFDDFRSSKFFLHSDSESSINRSSLLERLLSYWNGGLSDSFNAKSPTLASLSFFPLTIVAGELVNYLEVMYHSTKEHDASSKTALQQISVLDTDLSALQKWTRRSTATINKVNSILWFLKFSNSKDGYSEAIALLAEDYEYIAASLQTYNRQLEAMLPIVTSFIQIMNARRSLMQTENITRLTYLALVFVPLTFTCGIFSMNEKLLFEGEIFKVYFAVAIPLCIAVFLIARPPKFLYPAVAWLRVAKVINKAFPKQVPGSLEV